MAAYEDKPSRSWFAVFNNPADHGYTGSPEEVCEKLKTEWIESSPTRSGAWVYCISAAGLHHVHMVLEDLKIMKFGAIKKSYAVGMHFSPTMGKKSEVEDYINKVGKWEEKEEQILYTCTHGEIKGNQGRRNDLNKLYEMVKDGMSDYQILEENPQYMKYLNQVSKVRETIRYEEFKNKRRTDLKVEYWYGPPGTGKTSGVLDMYGDANVYIVTDYLHPWDSYKGQDIVLFDDFDSDRISTNDLLKWLDIYPLELPCRFSNKIACYTKVYFTSNFSPDDLWRKDFRWDVARYDALMRRIHVVRQFYQDGTSFERKTKPDPNSFVTVSPEELVQIELMFGK